MTLLTCLPRSEHYCDKNAVIVELQNFCAWVCLYDDVGGESPQIAIVMGNFKMPCPRRTSHSVRAVRDGRRNVSSSR